MDGFVGGAWSGEFVVPAEAMAQLTALNKSYPVVYDLDPGKKTVLVSTFYSFMHTYLYIMITLPRQARDNIGKTPKKGPFNFLPDGNNDANVPWLAPGRLLVFVKYRPLLNDTFNATGAIDGKPLIMRKAYNTIVPSKARFIGYFADATAHIRPGQQQSLNLTLPESDTDYIFSGGYIYEGNDLGSENATLAAAKQRCSGLARCVGFTFEKQGNVSAVCSSSMDGVQSVLYKAASSGRGTNTVCTALKPAAPIGVFFDNVQPLMGKLVL